MTTTIHPLVTIHHMNKSRVVFSREGKVYTAILGHEGCIVAITSQSGPGSRYHRTYTRDKAAKLFEAIEEIL